MVLSKETSSGVLFVRQTPENVKSKQRIMYLFNFNTEINTSDVQQEQNLIKTVHKKAFV